MEYMMKTEITKADILPLPDYIKVRKERHAALIALKKMRRIEIGPVATCYFENYDTMLHQVQESKRAGTSRLRMNCAPIIR